MKKLLLLVVLTISALVSAQEIQENQNSSMVIRKGNTYYYDGQAMHGDTYANFLKNNCEEAYKQYRTGLNTSIAGWVFMGVGLTCDVLYWAVPRATNPWARYMWIPALGFEIACIPTIAVGYVKMHRSAETYNMTCAKGPQAYWSVNASQNGIGLAYNF